MPENGSESRNDSETQKKKDLIHLFYLRNGKLKLMGKSYDNLLHISEIKQKLLAVILKITFLYVNLKLYN